MNESYDYAIAGASEYKEAIKQQRHPSIAEYVAVKRETTLEGRANIYIAPAEKEAKKTTVTVNTRYIFSIKVFLIVYFIVSLPSVQLSFLLW